MTLLLDISMFDCLGLVDTWRFSKRKCSLDGQVTWKSRWGPFTLTHNPIRFNGNWRCETGDAPFCKYNVITWYINHVTWWLRSTQLKWHFAKIGGDCPKKSEDKLSLHIRWSHDKWVTWIGGWDTFTLIHKGYSKSNRSH